MRKKKTIKLKWLLFSLLFVFAAGFSRYNDAFAAGETVSTSIPESYKNYVKKYTNNPSLFAYVTVYNFFSTKAQDPKKFVSWYGDKGYKECGSRAASSNEVTKCFLKLSKMGDNRHMDTVPSSGTSSIIRDMVKEMHKRKVYIITNGSLWAVFWRATAQKASGGGYNNIKFCGVAEKQGKYYSYRCIDAEKVVTAASGLERIKIGI